MFNPYVDFFIQFPLFCFQESKQRNVFTQSQQWWWSDLIHDLFESFFRGHAARLFTSFLSFMVELVVKARKSGCKMIPVPTDLSWNLVKSSQRALTPNSQCLLGTPLTSDEGPSADEHLTVIHILLVLMIFSFACQTWTSHLYQRWGDGPFVTREGSLSPFVSSSPLFPSLIQQRPSDASRGSFQNPSKWKLPSACLLSLWHNLRLPWAAGGDNAWSCQVMLFVPMEKLAGGIQLITKMSWDVNFTLS